MTSFFSQGCNRVLIRIFILLLKEQSHLWVCFFKFLQKSKLCKCIVIPCQRIAFCFSGEDRNVIICCYSTVSLQNLWYEVIVNLVDQNVLEFNKDTCFNGFLYSAIIFYNWNKKTFTHPMSLLIWSSVIKMSKTFPK